MNPTLYFHSKFRDHFQIFWKSIGKNGSFSRARSRQGQYLRGDPMGVITGGHILLANGQYFSWGDLILQPSKKYPDHLIDIPDEYWVDFLCGLFFFILIDQVIYTHFHSHYPEFQSITQYPKLDLSYGICCSIMMANPYRVFDEMIIESRGIKFDDIGIKFDRWSEFIIDLFREFFSKNSHIGIRWKEVTKVMLLDRDCTGGLLGSVLRDKLRKDAGEIIYIS